MYSVSLSVSVEDCAAFTQLDVPVLLLPLHSFPFRGCCLFGQLHFRNVWRDTHTVSHTLSLSHTYAHTFSCTSKKKKIIPDLRKEIKIILILFQVFDFCFFFAFKAPASSGSLMSTMYSEDCY